MDLSRRSFLHTGSKLGLAALLTGGMSSIAFGQKSSQLGSGIGATIPKEALGAPLSRITRAMFTENLKSRFTFRLGDVKLTDMTLVEVNELNPPAFKSDATSNKECFSLVFLGPRSLPLPQGTYTLEHGELGTFELFIVPGDASNRSGMRYGAVINRVFP